MSNEIFFEDENVLKTIKNKVIELDYGDLPLIIKWQGRTEYILKFTNNGKLLLNKNV